LAGTAPARLRCLDALITGHRHVLVNDYVAAAPALRICSHELEMLLVPPVAWIWKPKFISFEIGRSTYPDIFSALRLAGYSKFQLVNQLNNPSRTGTMYKFNDHSSGFFGEDLPKDKWLPFQEMVSRYVKYTDLRNLDAQELSLGWIDVHATF